MALFTTAPAEVHDALREGLERDHGAEVLARLREPSRPRALREDLERAEVRSADAYVVEIKAAAIDVVAETAARARRRDRLRRQRGRAAPGRAEPRRGARGLVPDGGAMNDRRPPESPVLSADTLLPFSKGLMAKRAHGDGDRAGARLRAGPPRRGRPERRPSRSRGAAPSAVYDVAAGVLAEHEDEQAVRRLRRYQRLQEVESPLVLLVGGATGTGKSTITTEVAHRLGINRVTSTDFVRQTMRAFFSEAFMPSIHYSSFEAGVRRRRGGTRIRATRTSAASSSRRATSSSACGERRAGAHRGPLDGARGRPPRARPRAGDDEGAHRVALRDRDHRRGGARAPLLRARPRLGRPAARGEVPRRAAGDPPHPGSAHRARASRRRACR